MHAYYKGYLWLPTSLQNNIQSEKLVIHEGSKTFQMNWYNVHNLESKPPPEGKPPLHNVFLIGGSAAKRSSFWK